MGNANILQFPYAPPFLWKRRDGLRSVYYNLFSIHTNFKRQNKQTIGNTWIDIFLSNKQLIRNLHLVTQNTQEMMAKPDPAHNSALTNSYLYYFTYFLTLGQWREEQQIRILSNTTHNDNNPWTSLLVKQNSFR